MTAFETTLPVRFGQVDYAGIMFYPRFFENFHAVFEDMFSEKLGVPYMSILKDRRIGFPTVQIETQFKKPFRFGEPMRLAIDVLKIGNSSIRFRYRAFNGSDTEVSASAEATVVVIDLDSFETLKIPADILAVLEELRVPAS
ncbi:MAG: 4-hydroxybenzoyl-CoA thioesterase [Planctomycetota bacterium]|nr:MAG: 4-hydroxybenzoyl-CoA thioesterase [Planctomycetota bacterium]